MDFSTNVKKTKREFDLKKKMKVDHTSCHSSEVVRGKWPKETLQIFSYTKNMGKFWSVSKDPYSIKHIDVSSINLLFLKGDFGVKTMLLLHFFLTDLF